MFRALLLCFSISVIQEGIDKSDFVSPGTVHSHTFSHPSRTKALAVIQLLPEDSRMAGVARAPQGPHHPQIITIKDSYLGYLGSGPSLGDIVPQCCVCVCGRERHSRFQEMAVVVVTLYPFSP